MRILVHDYSGHAFPVQLSRWLAGRGHEVRHCFSADILTPRGPLSAEEGDAPGFSLHPLSLGRELPKYALMARFFHERALVRQLVDQMEEFRPQVILSGNASPILQGPLARAARRCRIPFIFWVQDLYSLAARAMFMRRFSALAPVGLALARRWEFGIMAGSDAVVVIGADFVPIVRAGGVAADKITVLENWAPLSALPVQPRENPWRLRQGLGDRFVFLYAGTLGLKHDPRHLVQLARQYKAQPEVAVVVVTQGVGREVLEQARRQEGLDHLILLDYQPFAELAQVLGAADVLLVLLEREAGQYSIPSKVLSCLCAGRAILACLPRENLAARILEEAGAGTVVEDEAAFLAAAQALRGDPAGRAAMGQAARACAERRFNLERIGQDFLQVIHSVAGPGAKTPR